MKKANLNSGHWIADSSEEKRNKKNKSISLFTIQEFESQIVLLKIEFSANEIYIELLSLPSYVDLPQSVISFLQHPLPNA